MKIENSSVLITGGASGIGRIMGRIALEKGAGCVIIWDINQANIDVTLDEFNKIGKAYGFRVDVSKNEEIEAAYKQVVARCSGVDILINCAGIITSNKTFDKMTPDEIIRTMNINTIAPMLVTRAMLADMIARNKGHICNITSAAGMLGNPRMSVYGGSKWGALGWSDSVRIELQNAKSKVHVTSIAPFYISTGMFEGVKSRFFPILKPEYVAAGIIKGIEKNKRFCGIPFGYHFIRFWQFLLPTRIFDWFFGEVMGIYHTMDNFTGRKPAAKTASETKKAA